MSSLSERSLQRARETLLLNLIRAAVILLTLAYLVYTPPGRDISANEAALLVALFVISLLDIGLAQRGTADVDTALLVAGTFLYGASVVLLMCTLVRLSVHLLLRRKAFVEFLDALTKRYAAILVAAWALGPLGAIQVHPGLDVYVRVAVLGTVFVLVQLAVAQVGRAHDRGDSVFRLIAGNAILQGPLLAAGVSVAVLLVVIIGDMGPWGVALTLVLLVTMRRSFSLLLDIRASYQATIQVLVGAMEAQRTDEPGHGESAASLARAIAAELGFFGTRIERIGYATLLNYYGLRLCAEVQGQPACPPNPLAAVDFLRPVRPIIAPLEGSSLRECQPRDVFAAYVAARAIAEYSSSRQLDILRALGDSIGEKRVSRVERALKRIREKKR